jgi:hypothetical protein
MRIRTIKPEFFTHEMLYDAEEATGLPLRLAFAGLWCAADREGRFKWEARRLGVQIMPYDKIEFSRVLDALTTRGFIIKYACDGVTYGWIPSFSRHQVINNRERPSELPEPADSSVCDACSTRDPRVIHAGKAEGKGREGNMEGNGGGGEESPPPNEWAGRNKRIATYPEVLKWGKAQLPPVSQECCEAFFDRMEAEGWITKEGHPLNDWIPRFRSWIKAWCENSDKPNRKTR